MPLGRVKETVCPSETTAPLGILLEKAPLPRTLEKARSSLS